MTVDQTKAEFRLTTIKTSPQSRDLVSSQGNSVCTTNGTKNVTKEISFMVASLEYNSNNDASGDAAPHIQAQPREVLTLTSV